MNSHQPNGNAPLVNGLPSSGQQTDMTHLWGMIQQLSEALAESRAQNSIVLNGVHQLQARVSQDAGVLNSASHVNGETNGTNIAAQNAALEIENSNLRNQNTTLSAELESSNGLLDEYENSLRIILEKLRPWAFNHNQSLLSIHRHYQSVIDQERQEKLDQSLEQSRWQEGLGKVAEYARSAWTSQNEEALKDVSRLAELKQENKILRRLAGWEKLEDSDDEEEAEKKVVMEQQPPAAGVQG